MFCPLVMAIGDKNEDVHVMHRRNNPERVIRGIHVGIAKKSEGWLIYVLSMNMTYISNDVWFDKNFIGTHVHNKNRTRVPGEVHLQPHPEENLDDSDDQLEVVGHLLPLDQGVESGTPSQTSHPKTSVYFDVEKASPIPGVSFEPTKPEV